MQVIELKKSECLQIARFAALGMAVNSCVLASRMNDWDDEDKRMWTEISDITYGAKNTGDYIEQICAYTNKWEGIEPYPKVLSLFITTVGIAMLQCHSEEFNAQIFASLLSTFCNNALVGAFHIARWQMADKFTKEEQDKIVTKINTLENVDQIVPFLYEELRNKTNIGGCIASLLRRNRVWTEAIALQEAGIN